MHSDREFRILTDILSDGGITITLVCRAKLYFTALGRSRQLFASVCPERIVVESGGTRREMPVPGTAQGGAADAERVGRDR